MLTGWAVSCGKGGIHLPQKAHTKQIRKELSPADLRGRQFRGHALGSQLAVLLSEGTLSNLSALAMFLSTHTVSPKAGQLLILHTSAYWGTVSFPWPAGHSTNYWFWGHTLPMVSLLQFLCFAMVFGRDSWDVPPGPFTLNRSRIWEAGHQVCQSSKKTD